jgi:hypothetical protein
MGAVPSLECFCGAPHARAGVGAHARAGVGAHARTDPPKNILTAQANPAFVGNPERAADEFIAEYRAARAAGRLDEFAAAQFGAARAAVPAAEPAAEPAAKLAAEDAAARAAEDAAEPAAEPAVDSAVKFAADFAAACAAGRLTEFNAALSAADAAAPRAAESAAKPAAKWSKPSITCMADCTLMRDTTCDFIGACETLEVQHEDRFLLDHNSEKQALAPGEMPFIRFIFRRPAPPSYSVIVTNYGRIVYLDKEGRWDCRQNPYDQPLNRSVERENLGRIVRTFLVPFPAEPEARHVQSYWRELNYAR